MVNDDTSSKPRPAPRHVFDQTNGVLGEESEDAPAPAGGTTPPETFGIPPLTSL